jgi:ribonucleoside-diphosphate reductase alpha chain
MPQSRSTAIAAPTKPAALRKATAKKVASNPSAALPPLFSRHFTDAGVHPYETVEWELRDVQITDYRDGSVVFEQLGVEVPASWSQNAGQILAQKYFRGTQGTPEREGSLKQVVDRIVDTIVGWGLLDGYYDKLEAAVHSDELKYLLVHQMAAFNSPVWFNIGAPNTPQQGSACFILGVEDNMPSIFNWYTEEGTIFLGGSGAGVNLSKIRSSKADMSGGGTASGPISFMRGADASAGTIKSGGKTRRAAKMVVLDVEHPDIVEFVGLKTHQEEIAHYLHSGGFDVGFNGYDAVNLVYQNANNSVRVTDAFLEAVESGGDWDLIERNTGAVVETVSARRLWRAIAEAAWSCADPGIQYDSTIQHWHTLSNDGRITASNPCSEFLSLDNSACNLASLNLLTYLGNDGVFDVDSFCAAVDVIFLAQEIICGNSDYPTEKIAANAKRYRQLGIGFANLGALLMALGLAYDSDEGRNLAAAITSLQTGRAYHQSALYAQRVGPFEGFGDNRAPMLKVLDQHRAAEKERGHSGGDNEDAIGAAAQESWDGVQKLAALHGVRNSQASVEAPTGTIGLLMDCDTLGVEPDLSLVKTKKLAGGGTMSIVNQTVRRALATLGYRAPASDTILSYLDEYMTIVGAPGFNPRDLSVFATSMGDNVISPDGHLQMMGAIQPFISGAISKTVNLPEEATVEDIEDLHMKAWKLGIKAVAVYRDNCKVDQPLSTTKKGEGATAEVAEEVVAALVGHLPAHPSAAREKLPRHRHSETFSFQVADLEGYFTVGEYPDGRPGELFIKASKQGSTLAGIMDAFSIAISLGLQHGVPLSTYVGKYINMRFEPAGITDDPEIRMASSLVDYISRRLAVEYLDADERAELGIATVTERKAALNPPPAAEVEVVVAAPAGAPAATPGPSTKSVVHDAPLCSACGNRMTRSGSCYACDQCGSTTGCS